MKYPYVSLCDVYSCMYTCVCGYKYTSMHVSTYGYAFTSVTMRLYVHLRVPMRVPICLHVLLEFFSVSHFPVGVSAFDVSTLHDR